MFKNTIQWVRELWWCYYGQVMLRGTETTSDWGVRIRCTLKLSMMPGLATWHWTGCAVTISTSVSAQCTVKASTICVHEICPFQDSNSLGAFQLLDRVGHALTEIFWNGNTAIHDCVNSRRSSSSDLPVPFRGAFPNLGFPMASNPWRTEDSSTISISQSKRCCRDGFSFLKWIQARVNLHFNRALLGSFDWTCNRELDSSSYS